MKRNRSQWTLGGVGLWLIAAILATFVVCSHTEPADEPSTSSAEAEIEVDLVE